MTSAAGDFELWMLAFPVPGASVRVAEMAERNGWDGLLLTDTQNLTGDPYAALVLAAHRTRALRLGTGVTNPVTRHPAVTACSIATVHVESGGRAVLGIGRGDSSLAYLGRAPAPVAEFELYLERVQGYLRGEAVDLDGYPSTMAWIGRTGLPKVPVDAAATGPRTIAAAARHAERVTFAVGALPERVAGAVERARRARLDAGQEPTGVSLGAYVNVVCHPDPAVARDLLRGGVAAFARFSAMHGTALQDVEAAQRATLERLGGGYDMLDHGVATAGHAAELEDDFVERFGIAGPPDHCVERLLPLIDLGLDRLVVVGGSRSAPPGELSAANARFAKEVMPALRERAAAVRARAAAR